MGVLGRGLASLIPKRNRENAADMLEQIDHMEFEATGQKPQADVTSDPLGYRAPRANHGFEELEKIESMPMPDKPLVTPLTFDPFEGEGGAKAAIARAQAKRTTKTTSLKVEEVSEEMVAASPVVLEAPPKPPVAPPEPSDPEPIPHEAPAPVEVPEPIITQEVVEEKGEEVVAEEPAKASFGEHVADRWDQHEQNVEHIPIGDIKINPLQPRRTFDPQELEELMRSIEQHGILQPLVVRRLSGDQGFELIAGERRLRASKKLGWDKVPAVVRRDVKSDQSRLVFALIENIQRENLNPIEEALAYKQLNEEYGLTHEEVGTRVGKSRVAITNIVRILQLPAEIQRGLTEGKITLGHAKAILMIPDEEKQIKFYQHLLDEGLTVRKAEVRARRIQRTMNLHDPLRRRSGGKHPLALKYTPSLEEYYGFDAQLRHDEEKNKFEITFKAFSEAEVDQLVGRLLGKVPPAHDLDKDVMED